MTTREEKRWVELSSPGDPEVAAAARLLSKVAEPSAPSGSRQRVFRRLQKRSAPDRRMLVVALSGAAIGAIAVFFATRPAEPTRPEQPLASSAIAPVAEVVRVEGTAASSRADGSRVAIRAGSRLQSGSRLATDRSSSSELAVQDAGRLVLSPLTEINVAEIERVVDIDLTLGEVLVSVEAHAAKKLLVVAGRWSVTTDLGRARIKREGAEGIEVEVLAGGAEISGPKHLHLSEGERFTTREEMARTEEPKVQETPPAIEPDLVPRSDKATDPSSAPHKRSKSRVHRTLARQPAPSTPEPEERAPDLPPSPPPSAKVEVKEETPAIPAAPPESRHAQIALPEPSAPKPESTEALYQRARLENNPLKAMALFDQVVARNDAHAEIASYQAARTAMIAGRCREAIDRIRRHEERWANGSFAQELKLDVIECRIKLGELDAAGGDIEAFLSAYPRSPRSADVSFLRAELHRGRGELRVAIDAYEAARGGRHQADALFFGAWCAMRIGEPSKAKAGFERYLAKFPKGAHAKEAEEALANIP
jgi:TolA-binding protein/ferric-dicitrate binding protein FerR (iron transport regulator)